MEGWVLVFDIIQPVHICYASLMYVEWVRLRWWLEHLKISGSGIGCTSLTNVPGIPVSTQLSRVCPGKLCFHQFTNLLNCKINSLESALCAPDQKFSHRRLQPEILSSNLNLIIDISVEYPTMVFSFSAMASWFSAMAFSFETM